MFPNEWEKYRFMDEEQITKDLLVEEIENLDRRWGQTGSKGVVKNRIKFTIIFAVALVLWANMPGVGNAVFLSLIMILWILQRSSTLKGCGCLTAVLVLPCMSLLASFFMAIPRMLVVIFGYMFFAIVYAVFKNEQSKNVRIAWLTKKAKESSEKSFEQIVMDDSYIIAEEHPFGSSKAVTTTILVLAVVLAGLGSIRNGFTVYDAPVIGNEAAYENTEDENSETSYSWELGENGYILTDYDAGALAQNPVIPEQIDGIPVVAIGERAFQNETRVSVVVIPDSVTEIGSYAFKGCSMLSSVTMGDQVISIGGEAFYGCSRLTEFTVPAGVTEIRGNTFQMCTGLKKVTLHEGITAIHAYAFNGCRSLESIALPSGITEIRANTFENCTSLASINIPVGVTRIAAHAFRCCSSLAEVIVPSTVSEIGSSAFRECDALKRIDIPSGCDIDERSFKDSPTDICYY